MAEKKVEQKFSKYERARIIGARALQISMDAPLLMKADKEDLENLNYDPLRMAERELDSGVLPITINRPLPEKKSDKLKELKVEELEKEESEEKPREVVRDTTKDDSEEGEVVVEEKAKEATEMKADDELEEEIEEEGGISDSIEGESDSGSED